MENDGLDNVRRALRDLHGKTVTQTSVTFGDCNMDAKTMEVIVRINTEDTTSVELKIDAPMTISNY